ncbi:hypothetical protein COU61_03410 [Candidatus Pacearchaeota archaeon CG10_big_fil_rev_8_21_14_0_10_35_13]|nr:MAG: hypothetical protein COU61_03410 [Candidatus Pacearchaeota archaeon CG10_big_fil_rev_8_21_14_0_10_35_13]
MAKGDGKINLRVFNVPSRTNSRLRDLVEGSNRLTLYHAFPNKPHSVLPFNNGVFGSGSFYVFFSGDDYRRNSAGLFVPKAPNLRVVGSQLWAINGVGEFVKELLRMEDLGYWNGVIRVPRDEAYHGSRPLGHRSIHKGRYHSSNRRRRRIKDIIFDDF